MVVFGAEFNEIKGAGYSPETDSLRAQSTMTRLIRADTGELNGSDILDMNLTSDLVLTGDITVKTLRVMDGATISGPHTIIVTENVYIFSSHISTIAKLDVKGDVYSKRKGGDTGTTCQCNPGELNVLGNVGFENTSSTSNSIVMGNVSLVDSTAGTIETGGALTLDASTVGGGECNIGGNFEMKNGAVNNAGKTSVGSNATLSDSTYNMGSGDSFEVQGDCDVTNMTCDNMANWKVHGTLTMDAMPTSGSIDIEADDMVCGAAIITCTNNLVDPAFDGSPGSPGTGYGGGCGTGGSGGIGAVCIINVANTLNFTSLTQINITANAGGAGANNASAGGGGGGGAPFLGISANQIVSAGNFTINMTGGDGGGGGYATMDYNGGGGGGGGGVNDLGGNGGSGPGYAGNGGAGAEGDLIIHSSVSFSNYTVGALIGGSGGSGGVGGSVTTPGGDGSVGSTSSTVDTTALSTPGGWTAPTPLLPALPAIVTTDGVVDPGGLEFSIPIDIIELQKFDFLIEIEQVFTPKIAQAEVVEDSNNNPGSFSGTPPYVQGSGNVVFTFSGLFPANYRWRVLTIKDDDVTSESLFSQWRSFEISS